VKPVSGHIQASPRGLQEASLGIVEWEEAVKQEQLHRCT
jgi:hypothetical protein